MFCLTQYTHSSNLALLLLLLLLLLTENGFIPAGNVLQWKTGQYNTVRYNKIQ